MGWESKRDAFRLYFDKRNAIDLYGKPRPSLQLDRYATPGYIYHNYSPDGRDIYLVANALGIGAPAGWVNGTAEHVADVDDRSWHIVSTGPVRAIIELTYKGWKIAGKSVDFQEQITQWAGERGFLQTIKSSDAGDLVFATGLTQQQGIPELRSPIRGRSGMARDVGRAGYRRRKYRSLADFARKQLGTRHHHGSGQRSNCKQGQQKLSVHVSA